MHLFNLQLLYVHVLLFTQGYQCLIDDHHYKSIVRIRGDNYCALRASYASMILHNMYSEQSTNTAMQVCIIHLNDYSNLPNSSSYCVNRAPGTFVHLQGIIVSLPSFICPMRGISLICRTNVSRF